MKAIKVTRNNNISLIHYVNPIKPLSVSLCGRNIYDHSSDGLFIESVDTSSVNCPDCIKIRNACIEDELKMMEEQLEEERQHVKILLDCLNGSSKAKYTAEMYDAQSLRADKAQVSQVKLIETLQYVTNIRNEYPKDHSRHLLLKLCKETLKDLEDSTEIDFNIIDCAIRLVDEMKSNRHWRISLPIEQEIIDVVEKRKVY